MLQTEIEETPKGPVEITEDEEGATIDFDPNAMPVYLKKVAITLQT